MPRRMTMAEARDFRKRWKAVNAAEREELRTTPMDVKLRQLAALMASVESMGWTEPLRAGEQEVRDRWNLLRRKLHG